MSFTKEEIKERWLNDTLEEQNLDKNIKKLQFLLNSKNFTESFLAERWMIEYQITIMNDYLTVLRARINALSLILELNEERNNK